MTEELNARQILSQLRAGKSISVASMSKTYLLTLRSRIATLKCGEDKLLDAVDLLGPRQMLSCGIVTDKSTGIFTMALKLGAPKKAMTFAVVVSEDEAESDEQPRA